MLDWQIIIEKHGLANTMVTKVFETGENRYITTVPVGAGTGLSLPTILTIRARKSDIDAFANGQLSFDQFHQKTQMFTYSHVSVNVGGMSSRTEMGGLYGETEDYDGLTDSTVDRSSGRSSNRRRSR